MCARRSISLNFDIIRSGRILYIVYVDDIHNILWELTVIENFAVISLAYVLDAKGNHTAILEIWGGYGFFEW